MANKNSDNDEYHFADLDGFNDNLLDENNTKAIPHTVESLEQSNNRKIRRNAMLVVVLIILAMFIYKFMGSFIPHKSSTGDVQPQSTQPVIAEQTAPSTDATSVQQNDSSHLNLSKNINESSTTSVDAVNQKLAVIEISQQSITNDINNMTNQIGQFNASIDNLNARLTNLNEAISTLTTKVAQQSDKLAALTIIKEKPIVKTQLSHPSAPVLHYYINAIIPGRAWLIATNGSTLTVREGSRVSGLGIIKLIDANQGRVLTSSGKTIRFSQQDS